jgi:DNA-binding PadR family transcriptional regulator
MDETNTDVIQGTLDLLILKTLSLQPMHGFGIARRVEDISRGVFKVNPGSLLTALQRLERAGWLDAHGLLWGTSNPTRLSPHKKNCFHC